MLAGCHSRMCIRSKSPSAVSKIAPEEEGLVKYSWLLRVALCSAFIGVAAIASTSAQQVATAPHPAVPVEPIAFIIDAFRTYSVVALGEGPHGNEQGHAFRLSLIRDPRFAATVSDIVVECGNGRHQDVLDRFVRGDQVSEEALSQVLRDSSNQNGACDKPIYADFFRAVRVVNASLTDRKLRVLLGDPAVNWDTVRTWEDLRKQAGGRDTFVVNLIRREVVAKQHRALIIYGDGHFQARKERPARSMLAQLDSLKIKTLAISNVFSDLARLQADIASWPKPSLALLRGTPIGRRPFSSFYGPLPPGVDWPIAFEDHFDAILYLGPPSSMTMSRLPPELCADPTYMEMRTRRMALDRARGGSAIDGLKLYCGAQTTK